MADINGVTVTAQDVRDTADLVLNVSDAFLEKKIKRARSFILGLTTLDTARMSDDDAVEAIALYAAGLAHLKEPRTTTNAKSGRTATRELNAGGHQNEFFRTFWDHLTPFRSAVGVSQMR